MYHIVYKTTNILNGKFYVGVHSTDNLQDGYLGSGKYFKRSINKYGEENFNKEILMICDSQEDAFELENLIVDKELVESDLSYNLVLGGSGFSSGKDHPYFGTKFTSETKSRMSISMSGKNHSMFGKKHSKESLRKMSESHKGRLKGKNHHFYGKTGKDSLWFGRNHSEKSKEKSEFPN